MQLRHFMTAGAMSGLVSLLMVSPVAAQSNTVVVTPTQSQGWYSADTRPGGQYAFIADNTSPLPDGALQLTTDATNAAKVQYLKDVSLPLAEVTKLQYSTKQNGGPATADPSYQLVVDLNGNGTGMTTMVYEPYWNGTVVPNTWQTWDVSAGLFWSSRTVSPFVVSGAGGPPFYTLAELQQWYPHARVQSIGVNVGSYNPGYNVETDGVVLNDVTYDFELTHMPKSKDDCKQDGYANFTDRQGQAFRNQGQCVSYFNHS